MLVGAAIVLASVNARLTLIAALAMPPIAVLTYVFAHRVFPISRDRAGEEGPPDRGLGRGRRRDRDGAGVRPRGRRARALRRARRGRAARDDAPGGGRGALPAGADLPALARDRRRPLLRRPRRDRRHADDRRSSRSSSPCCCSSCGRSRRSAGSSTSASARRRPRRAASPGSTRSSRCPSRRSPSACPTGPLTVRFEDVHFSYGDGQRGAARASTSRWRRARSSPSAAPTGAGQDVAAQPAAALLRPDRRAACSSAASTAATSRSPSCGASVALVTQKPVLFSVPLRDNLLAARPDADWADVLGGLRGGRRRRLRRRAAGRLRHADRRARRQPLRRAAPARRARARAHRRARA